MTMSDSRLPRTAYTDQTWYDRERTELFRDAWSFIGIESDLAKAGDTITGAAGPYPLFQGDLPEEIDPMARVVVAQRGDDGLSMVTLSHLRDVGELEADGLRFAWREGVASALDSSSIASGRLANSSGSSSVSRLPCTRKPLIRRLLGPKRGRTKRGLCLNCSSKAAQTVRVSVPTSLAVAGPISARAARTRHSGRFNPYISR